MKKMFLALLLCATFVSFAYSDVYIKKVHRVKNRQPGYCCWVSLSTLARHQNIKKLINIDKDREKDPDVVITEKIMIAPGLVIDKIHVVPKNGATHNIAKEKLESMKVKFKITYHDRKHLKDCVDGKGGVIFFFTNPLHGGGHAVVITAYDDKFVTFLDTNDVSYHKVTREWFDKYWEGTCISLEENNTN